MMKYMEKHNAAFASMSKQSRRVNIDQNHTWRLRILPVSFGPEKEPFVSIAQHWWNKSPITCPRHTTPAWGGDPDYPCPICDTSDILNESQDKEKSDIGYRVRCSIRVRSWCVVFDIEDPRGNIEEPPTAEILNPYEFDMFKTTWEAFSKYQRWALSRRRGASDSDWGLLDLETGCDLLATQGGRGVSLDRCDPAPIFPLDDPKYNEYIQKIWSRLHEPKIIIPDERQLLEIADKVQDYADNGARRYRDEGGGRGRGPKGRGRDYDEGGGRGRGRNRDQDDYDDRGTSDRGSSRRSSRSRYQEDGDPADQDAGSQQEAQTPARRRSATPEAERGPAPPPRRASAPAHENQQPEQPQRQERPAATAPPPARRLAQPVPETAADGEDPGDPPTAEDLRQDQTPSRPTEPPPARRTATSAPQTSSPPPARRTTVPSASNGGPPPARRSNPQPESGVDPEEDNVPEEQNDHAPKTPAEVEEPPPGVEATGPAPRRTESDPKSADIRSRLDKLNAKGR